MRKIGLFGPAILAMAAPLATGCALNDTGSSASSADELSQSTALSDHVEVAADRLTFDQPIQRSAELTQIVAKVKSYQAAYANAEGSAPTTLARESAERDAWVVDHLLAQKVSPVILVGMRQANALNSDGTIRTDVKNPNGYLRRAVSVTNQDGQLVVVTKPASLIDANQELQRLGLIQVTRDNGNSSGNANTSGDDDDGTSDGWNWQKTYPFTLADVDLSQTLYEHDIGAGIGKVVVGFKDSHLKVSGNLDAMAAGKWVHPRAAHAILSMNIDGKLLLDGSFDGAFGASSGNVDLYRKSFNIATVGSFPLTFDFAVVATCDLAANGQADAQVGATLQGSLSAGATYDTDKGIDTVWNPQWPQFAPLGPTLTSASRVEGKCGVTATATIHLFDAVGPDASATAYVQIDANTTSSQATGTGEAKVTAGVDAQFGGSLEPFGINLGSIETDPFHKDWVIFDKPIHF